jgi:hypothetical protein
MIDIAPKSADAPAVAAAEAPKEYTRNESPDFHGTHRATQALRVIDGEQKAAQYIARLQAQQASPDELAVIVSMLYGAAMRGFCGAIEKALRVRHG